MQNGRCVEQNNAATLFADVYKRQGVQMVHDVLPWEEMKLRMLNGSHSFLAYLGYLLSLIHI